MFLKFIFFCLQKMVSGQQEKYRVFFFYWSPLKCLSNLFELDPPTLLGGSNSKKLLKHFRGDQ